MLAYYFTPYCYGKQNLQEKRLKISIIEDLNDPFELLCFKLPKKDSRRLLVDYREELSRSTGVICFSRTWSQPLLWSHYADKHKGICLCFELDNKLVHEIKYINSRIDFGLITKDIFNDFILCSKFKDWEYENEIRIYEKLRPMYKENDKFFRPFDENMVLKKVILGCRTSLNDYEEIKNILSLNFKMITVQKARIAFNSFRVVQDMRY